MFYTYSIFLHFRVIQPVIVTRHPVIKKTLTVTHPQRNGFHQRFETVWQLIEIMYETTLSLKSCMKLPYHWNHVWNYLIIETMYETTLSLKSCMKLPYHWNHVWNYLIIEIMYETTLSKARLWLWGIPFLGSNYVLIVLTA